MVGCQDWSNRPGLPGRCQLTVDLGAAGRLAAKLRAGSEPWCEVNPPHWPVFVREGPSWQRPQHL
jgi:hypothetical protein